MTASLYFLRTIYAVGGIQLASIFLAWYGQSGLMVADSVALFLADWTAFTIMAHRHARLSPLSPNSHLLSPKKPFTFTFTNIPYLLTAISYLLSANAPP